MANNEKLAEQLFCAVCKLAEDEEKRNGMKWYLSRHFDAWMEKFCTTPVGLVSEFCEFAGVEFDDM